MISMLILNNSYPVMLYRRVQEEEEESNELYIYGSVTLVLVREPSLFEEAFNWSILG